jgi:CBS domain-containing protein
MRAVTAVADLPLQPVLALRGDVTIADAARSLIESDAGVALVLLWPIVEITEHDIAAALAENVRPDTLLRDLQFGSTCFARTETTIDEALAMMLSTGRRALVVVNDARALGIVRLSDAIEARLGESTWTSAFGVALHIGGNDQGGPR